MSQAARPRTAGGFAARWGWGAGLAGPWRQAGGLRHEPAVDPGAGQCPGMGLLCIAASVCWGDAGLVAEAAIRGRTKPGWRLPLE